ncbi:MAG: STAS domain-containing protein [Verrucomicrobia bacterium]|nr:STAS domain-containing protein [Verrucomicrobiota bacterium]
MSDTETHLHYRLRDEVVWVKISGRANCMVGTDFLALVNGFRELGRKQFSLDLRDCVVMDSSFLGTLAWLEQDLGTGALKHGTYAILLAHPNGRVTDLIRSLGLDEFFKLTSGPVDFPEDWIPIPPTAARSSSATCSQISLDAHEVIVRLNPANEPKFRDVMDFLREEVEREKQPKPVPPPKDKDAGSNPG